MPPPLEVSSRASTLLARLERLLGRQEGATKSLASPGVERANRVRALRARLSLAGHPLEEGQVAALLDGQAVSAPARDLQAAENFLRTEELLAIWSPSSPGDFLEAHGVLMDGLGERAGKWRTDAIEFPPESGRTLVPPPVFGLPSLVKKLLSWAGEATEVPAPLRAALCHHQLQCLCPFQDGNRCLALFWHQLLLSRHHPLFTHASLAPALQDRESEYCEALALSDEAGTATPFLEFALELTLEAVTTTQALPQGRQAAPDRLRNARDHFGTRSFRRKDYLTFFPGLSTATASRDLQHGVATQSLTKAGDKATTRYQFC